VTSLIPATARPGGSPNAVYYLFHDATSKPQGDHPARSGHGGGHRNSIFYNYDSLSARLITRQDELIYTLEGTYRVKLGYQLFDAPAGLFISSQGERRTRGRTSVTPPRGSSRR
jgi:hypothetical protein